MLGSYLDSPVVEVVLEEIDRDIVLKGNESELPGLDPSSKFVMPERDRRPGFLEAVLEPFPEDLRRRRGALPSIFLIALVLRVARRLTGVSTTTDSYEDMLA